MRSIALVTLAGLLAASGASAQTLRIGLNEDPDVLDPHRARTYVGRIVFTSLCDKLIEITPQLEFTPQLATEWSYDASQTTLTFKLREGVTFHDGTPFDAAAAKANIERAKTLPDSLRKSELASVERAEAPDPTTLVLHLSQPDATVLAQLSDRAGMMLSPTAFKAGDFSQNPACTGPFKFVSRVQNDRIELTKFQEYWNAAEYPLKNVVFLPITDSTVKLANLRSGDIDMLERLAPSDVPDVESDPNLQLVVVTGIGYQSVRFNVNNGERARASPVGADKRVRHAFQLAVGRDVINEVAGNGIFPPAQQPYPPASPYHSDKFPLVTRDVEKAKALLAEAGVPNPSFELAFGTGSQNQQIAELMQAMAAEAGFQVNLRATEFAAMQKEMQGGNFDAAVIGWSGRVDPDGNIHQFATCKGNLNDGRYCNEAVDKALNEARRVSDVAARKALYEEAEAILQDDLPTMYTYYQPWPFVLAKDVTGFTPYPDGMIRLKGVSDPD